PGAPLWREPHVRIMANCRYEAGSDLVRIDQLHVQSSALTASSSGSVSRLGTHQDFSLTGELSYELARVEPQLRPYLGQGVRLMGGGRKPFKLEGSLGDPKPLATLRGEAAIHLTTA